MARVINFDKGSKRRLHQIQWSTSQRASALLLFFVLFTLCIAAALSSYPVASPQPGTYVDDGR